MLNYGGPQVPRHKQKAHGTNKKITAPTKRSRHQQKDYGTNKKITAPTKRSRHQQKAHGTNKKITARTKNPRHKSKVELERTGNQFKHGRLDREPR